MAGVYHGRGNWVEIDGSTIIRTVELQEKLQDYQEIIDYNDKVRDMYSEGYKDALAWVLQNSDSYVDRRIKGGE